MHVTSWAAVLDSNCHRLKGLGSVLPGTMACGGVLCSGRKGIGSSGCFALGTVTWLPGIPAIPLNDQLTGQTQAACCSRKSPGQGWWGVTQGEGLIGEPGSPTAAG